MEIGILRRILKRAKRWHLVEDEVPRLPERRDIGRALQQEEKLRLLRVAQSKPEWETAYLASVLALNTTMRGCEVKQLRWRDIDFMDHCLVIRCSKTLAGERVIPLNANAYNAILRLRERAQMLFGPDLQADWYVFPSAEGYSTPDPTKPMSGWRSAWRSLTRTVRCPACGEFQNPAATCRRGAVRRGYQQSQEFDRPAYGSTICATTPSRNLPNPRRATGQSCLSRVTSRNGCWPITRTSELRQREKRWMRWR